MDRNRERASIEALEELYRGSYQRFLRLALALVGTREGAADVVQDAFAQALRARGDYRGDGSLQAWVWRIVVNVARTHNQRRRSAPHAEESDSFFEQNGLASTWPELRGAVAALPERQRHALFLRHYADLSYDEIGDVLGMARGTVSATLHGAHESLRRTLEEVQT
jgi:RNA polymerase sigma factor (sigma-70 family)